MHWTIACSKRRPSCFPACDQFVRVLPCSLSGPVSALVRTVRCRALQQTLNELRAAASKATRLSVPAHNVASSSRVFQLQGVQSRKYVSLF